ncbi:hypothetical protein [Qipengyuania sp. JC766]|uniref:hypothetical protein n=1 Tax=Qipengyuania sp. JC766 TaxID=3232139 RepID=UPI0034583E2A
MHFRSLALVSLATLALVGCDAATQIAGDAVEGEVRNAVTTQCEGVAESAGIVADRISEVCQCSADAFLEDSELTVDDISRENIEGIVNACADSTDPSPSTADQESPE